MKELPSDDPELLKLRYDLNPFIIIGGIISLGLEIFVGHYLLKAYQAGPKMDVELLLHATGLLAWISVFSLSYRSGINVDRKSRRLIRWWGFLNPCSN